MSKQFTIKPMTIEDYDGLHALWMTTGIPAPVW